MLRTLIVLIASFAMTPSSADDCPETLNFTLRSLAGEEQINLCEAYRNQVVLIVNTASKCAFTSQYEGLESLYSRYRDQGFVVLGFPSNDFGGQEPGSEESIREFCRLTYSVEFPMFEKTHAKEGIADPLFATLGRLSGTYPRWNFYKYLLDRDGELIDVYSSMTGPENARIVKKIEQLLAQPVTQ
jgi:glutathione peroxidase